MTCLGIDAISGAPVEVRFDSGIHGVDHLISPPPDLPSVSAGWIDLQVNGFAGADFNDASTSHEAISRALEAMFATGVTRCFPTVITGAAAAMQGALRNLAAARRALPHGAAMEAFHVEGPHISPDDGPRGAHPREHVRPPDLDEFRRLQEAAEGYVRLVTLSPEWPEATRYIEALVGEGVVVSIGHTKADTAQIADAVRAGATMSTHLGNGAHAVLPRHPNYLWDQLAEPRLNACFILDGIHLGVNFPKVAIRAKGIERCVLVTDAVMPAACDPGPYQIGEIAIELHPDGRVTLAGQSRLAGSSLQMHHAVSYVMRHLNYGVREAVVMASTNPARVGRLVSRQRGLAPGERADVVLFTVDPHTKAVRVMETYLSGRRVYQAAS